MSVQPRGQAALGKLTAAKGRGRGRSPLSRGSHPHASPPNSPLPGRTSQNVQGWRRADPPGPRSDGREEEGGITLAMPAVLPRHHSPQLTPAGRDCESYAGLQIPAALNPGAAGVHRPPPQPPRQGLPAFMVSLRWVLVYTLLSGSVCLSFIPVSPLLS